MICLVPSWTVVFYHAQQSILGFVVRNGRDFPVFQFDSKLLGLDLTQLGQALELMAKSVDRPTTALLHLLRCVPSSRNLFDGTGAELEKFFERI